MAEKPVAEPVASVTVRQVAYQEIHVQTQHSWCRVQWQENGRVIILSDYGDWSYFWSHRGSASTAKFLSQLDSDYMCHKLLGTNALELDTDLTYKEMRRAVKQARRDKQLTKDEARDEMERVEDFTGGQTAFEMWVADSALADAYECARHSLNSSWRHFWERLWVPYVKPALREIAAKENSQGERASV